MRLIRSCALAAFAVLGAAAPAFADGYPPYYGFSGYFGGPAPYYTHDTDVHQSTTMEDGSPAFGTRTYTAGGPFWGYRNNVRKGHGARHRKARHLRVRG